MSSLKTSDRKILEKLFGMGSGYVLNFSDRTMDEFFKEEFKISIYDKKYDFDNLSRSKANRLHGIWIKEDDITVGGIILALVNYAENDSLTNGKEITVSEKELIKKARDIGTNLLFPQLSGGLKPEVQALQNKAQIIKDFNSYDLKTLKVNERIYLLKVLYSYYEAIIRAYYGPGLFFVSSGIDDLNDYFKVLRKRLIELVDLDDTFSEIKNSNTYGEVVDQITSLYSSAEFLDVVWDSLLPSIINLREEIADKDLFENNLEIQKTGLGVSNFLEIIAKEIDALEKYLGQKTKNFYEKELPKSKEKMGDFFGTAKKDEIIKHEHKHFFENSVQEKSIDLNHKFEKDNKIGFYITKKGDDIHYKGHYINLSKNTDYYKVFCALYAKLPEGGEIDYKDLIVEVKSRIPKTMGKTTEEMQKFIQRNLTDNGNGFVRYAGIPETEDNGKPLIYINRGFGVIFNNKIG